MDARQFYNKRLEEDNTIGSIQLMEEFAKKVIEDNFCDGTSIDFNELTIEQLKNIHAKINELVNWVNS